ncbi:MAG: corrinoid protein-associated methyltransferase CpaM [Candidatus Methylomirabilales bacterium]
MSTYVLMRILESAPSRYDLGIRLLTLGCLDRAYDRLASHVEDGQQVMDLGCGTGALALRAARRGGKVKAIDINARMLEIAAQRAREAGLAESVTFVEMGVAELDGEKAEKYDAVMSGLCFSELSEDERAYTLRQVGRILRPGGLLLVADEVKPRTLAARVVQSLARTPLVVLAYLITQQTTHPIAELPKRLTEAGLTILSVKSGALQSFIELVAQKPAGVVP